MLQVSLSKSTHFVVGGDLVCTCISYAGSLLSGVVGCEHLTLTHAIEHFSGVVILNSRRDVGQLDLNRLPKLKLVSLPS